MSDVPVNEKGIPQHWMASKKHEPLTELELRMLVYEALFEKVQAGDDPRAFVGLQGEKIVVMQPGGAHFAVLVVEAHVEVAG